MEECKKFAEEISAYLDGELSSKEAEDLSNHLQQCMNCRQKMEELKEVWKILDQYDLEEPSSRHTTRFYTQTLPTFLIASRYRKRSPLYRPVAAAMFAGMILGFFFYHLVVSVDYRQQDEIFEYLDVLKNPQFELIHSLELLEHYEVLKYFSPETLSKWKQKQ